MALLSFLLTSCFFNHYISAQESTISTLQFASTKPCIAFPLPQDLLGLSIEADRWPDWVGNVSHKNEYTYTLLSTLKEMTGVAPRIRVGGDTQDHTISTTGVTGNPGYYDVFAPVPENITGTKQLFPEALFVGAGYDYWLCSGNLPKGSIITWGVNLGAGNASEAVAEVQDIVKAFADPHCKDVQLLNIEIGNEPDNFRGGSRPTNWTIWEYSSQYIEYFEAINSAVKQRNLKYRIGDFAGGWSAAQLLSTGILESVMGPSVNAISEHHYQTNVDATTSPAAFWPSYATQLTTKSNIRGNLSRFSASVLDAQKSGISFVLGETNTFFGHGQPGVSNSAAAALWLVDYSLQAASIGVDCVYFHQGIGYNYSAFEPLNNIGINITDYEASAKRHVLPEYYGMLAVADAIGTSGNAFINELWTDNSNFAAYQIWEGDQSKRLMLINEVPWTAVSNGTRPTLSVDIPDLQNARATYKRLDFSSLSATSGITWGGQSWDTYSGLPNGSPQINRLTDGSIELNASSAVLVYL